MSRLQKVLIAVLLFMLVIAMGGAYYFYSENKKIKAQPAETSAVEVEVEGLVEEIGRLIELPEGEDPTVATVSDPALLRDQPFFARAKAGDKVLLYSEARKAYLYDPIAKKLIEVAPLSVGGEPETVINE